MTIHNNNIFWLILLLISLLSVDCKSSSSLLTNKSTPATAAAAVWICGNEREGHLAIRQQQQRDKLECPGFKGSKAQCTHMCRTRGDVRWASGSPLEIHHVPPSLVNNNNSFNEQMHGGHCSCYGVINDITTSGNDCGDYQTCSECCIAVCSPELQCYCIKCKNPDGRTGVVCSCR